MAPISSDKVNVFVHLAAGHDAVTWGRRWASGELIGLNDATPYGYGRANEMGCAVRFSDSPREFVVVKLMRLVVRGLLGFDLVHAWRNRKAIFASDVVWTHTESQFLAVALLFLVLRAGAKRPRLIGQAVWMLDSWERLSPARRWFYRRLLAQIDVLTVHSPSNCAIARRLFPAVRVELVRFGIPNERFEKVKVRNSRPLSVLCVGNDRHRDWACAIKAVANRQEFDLTIVSSTAGRRLASGAKNVKIRTVESNSELLTLMANSSVMLVPLKPNYHASGITVIEEAALMGLPLVVSDTGGLRAYFGADCVRYVPPNDADAIRQALDEAFREPERMAAQAQRAQVRGRETDLGCEGYIRHHVTLTRQLLKLSEPVEEGLHYAHG